MVASCCSNNKTLLSCTFFRCQSIDDTRKSKWWKKEQRLVNSSVNHAKLTGLLLWATLLHSQRYPLILLNFGIFRCCALRVFRSYSREWNLFVCRSICYSCTINASSRLSCVFELRYSFLPSEASEIQPRNGIYVNLIDHNARSDNSRHQPLPFHSLLDEPFHWACTRDTNPRTKRMRRKQMLKLFI